MGGLEISDAAELPWAPEPMAPTDKQPAAYIALREPAGCDFP